MTTPTLDEARAHADAIKKAYQAYTAKGWKCLPILPNSKVIRLTGWQDTAYTLDDFKGLSNIGVQLGAVSGNLIDIDLDHPIARKIGSWFLPPTGWRFGRIYPGESDSVIPSHYLYHVEGGTKSSADWRLSKKETGGAIVKCIEYRGDNSQTVFPPSRHEHAVQWVDCTGEPPLIDEADLKMALGVMMTVIWVKHSIAPGIRHDSMLRVIGGFAKAGVPIEMARRAVKAISYLIDDDEDKQGDVDDTYKRLADGKPVAGFASLEAFGWETDRVKKWLPSKIAESGKVAKEGKPKINLTRVSMEDAVNEAVKIIAAVPDSEKTLFSYAGSAVVVMRRGAPGYNDTVMLRPGSDAFAHHLEGHVQFVRVDGKEKVDVVIEADSRLVRRMMDPSINWGMPRINGVCMYPLVTREGHLVTDEGFNRDTSFYIGEGLGITQAEVDKLEVADALTTLQDLYADFPFHSREIGLSLSITTLLSAVARKVLDKAPAFIVTSPYPADGKTIWSYLPQIILSKEPANYSLSGNEEEQIKQLTSYFMEDPDVMVFDNQNGRFHSQALTELITSGKFKARLLGKNDTVQFTPRTTLIVNGINVRPSEEIMTRSIVVEFDRRITEEFTHPQLLEYALSRRRAVLCAVLRLLQNGARAPADAVPAFRPSRFYEWDQFVRRAVIVAGLIDPMRDDLRVRAVDEDYSLKDEFVGWLFRTFPPGERFSSSDIQDKIGFDRNLEATLLTLGRMRTLSTVAIGRAVGNVRGAEYSGYRLTWRAGYANRFYGEFKSLTGGTAAKSDADD